MPCLFYIIETKEFQHRVSLRNKNNFGEHREQLVSGYNIQNLVNDTGLCLFQRGIPISNACLILSKYLLVE